MPFAGGGAYMQQKNFQLLAADALNCGTFTDTPLGALMFSMLNGDAAAYERLECEIDLLESLIVSTLELAADGVENGDKLDGTRAGQVADVMRLAASLTGFCISARNVRDVAARITADKN